MLIKHDHKPRRTRRERILLSEERLVQETIYHILEAHHGIVIETGIFHITATIANSEQADMLAIASGAPLLLIQRISYTSGDIPIYMQDRYYRPDCVNYRVTLHRHSSVHDGLPAIRELRPVFSEQPSWDGNA